MLLDRIGPAFELSRWGYDVWLANTRGNLFSRRHRQLDPDLDEEFWDFTFEDVGRYDTKAVIIFILNHTKAKKLDYIGHSMGCTVLLLQRDEGE